MFTGVEDLQSWPLGLGEVSAPCSYLVVVFISQRIQSRSILRAGQQALLK
jgi:hypothetical protein